MISIVQFTFVFTTILISIRPIVGFGGGHHYHYHTTTQKNKCLNPPRTARRVENYIGECQEEVKNKLVNEAYQILKYEVAKEHPNVIEEDNEYAFDLIETTKKTNLNDVKYPTDQLQEDPQGDYYALIELANGTPENSVQKKDMARLLHRIRRIGDVSGISIYHPTLVPFEDKRIAGCLLHCVYAKNNAIDKNGWPTLDGLVDFYSEGVNEHGFFMATLRSVNLCLRAVTNKYRINRRKLPEQGESCDLAFDVFDCISDQITGYCLDQYK